jgi:hypothetical protein
LSRTAATVVRLLVDWLVAWLVVGPDEAEIGKKMFKIACFQKIVQTVEWFQLSENRGLGITK